MTNLLKRILPARPDRSADRLARLARQDVKVFSATLSQKLEQLNLCYRYKRNEKDFLTRGIKRITFNLCVLTERAAFLRVDTSPRAMPQGVATSDIDRPEVLTDLELALGRQVRYRRHATGAWIEVALDIGAFGLRKITFAKAMDPKQWEKMPKKPLMLPIGLGMNNQVLYRSLADFPHALVGGATGAGKTTLLHGWICALIMKTPPDMLKLVLVDLKGGVEFTRYKGLPHLWTHTEAAPEDAPEDAPAPRTHSGFVKRREDVIPVLELLRTEMDRRLARFEAGGGIQNIRAWNHRHRGDKLPYIVVFMDELASLMLEPDLKKVGERLLADIGARGRAPGIHLVIATQRPEVSVVSGRIKGNLDARCGFRVPDLHSSMVILDDKSASDFPETAPRGRFVYKLGNDRHLLQAAWIGPGTIKNIVRAVEAGRVDDQTEAARVDPVEIFSIALKKLDGSLSVNKLWPEVRKLITKPYLETMLKDHEGELVELNGQMYEVRPGEGQFDARRLVASQDGDATSLPQDKDGRTGGELATGLEAGEVELAPIPSALADLDDELARKLLTWARWALAENDGVLSVTKIRQHFRCEKQSVSDGLAHLEGRIIEGHYCEPGDADRRIPRKLIKTEEDAT